MGARAARATGALMLAGLCGVCVGTYAVLDRTAPRVLALPMLALGAAVALTGLVGAGSRVTRSRYRPDTWRLPEWLVLGSGIAAASIAVVARHWITRTGAVVDADSRDVWADLLDRMTTSVRAGYGPPPVATPAAAASTAPDATTP